MIKTGPSKSKLTLLLIALSLLFWPLSLFFTHPITDFLKYVTPALLIWISYLFSCQKSKHWPLFILIIPLINPTLIFLPLLTIIFLYLLPSKSKILSLVYLALTMVIFTISLKPFYQQSIFTYDYQARQAVIRKTYLYPTVWLARAFQNKANIIIDKFENNFFALVDPNNYFFAFHPREIIATNYNFNKYPFIALIFTLFGLYHLQKIKNWPFIVAILASSIINLSLVSNFDLNDFILFIPLSLIFIHGLLQMHKSHPQAFKLLALAFVIFTLPQLIRLYLIYHLK